MLVMSTRPKSSDQDQSSIETLMYTGEWRMDYMEYGLEYGRTN